MLSSLAATGGSVCPPSFAKACLWWAKGRTRGELTSPVDARKNVRAIRRRRAACPLAVGIDDAGLAARTLSVGRATSGNFRDGAKARAIDGFTAGAVRIAVAVKR